MQCSLRVRPRQILDSPAIPNQVEYTKDQRALAAEGQVGSILVVLDWVGDSGGSEQLVHLVRRTDLVRGDVDGQGEEPDENEEGGGVGPVGEQGGSHTTHDDVERDEDGNEEDGGLSRHSSEIVDRGGLQNRERVSPVHKTMGRHTTHSSQDQHGRDDDVGKEPKEEEDEMCAGAPSLADDFQKGVSVGCLHFEVRGENGKEEDLDGGSGGISVGSSDTESKTDSGACDE